MRYWKIIKQESKLCINFARALLTTMSVCPIPLSLYCVLSSLCTAGQPSQPETIPPGTHWKTCLCPTEMGSRVQGLSGQHWWLYEPAGQFGPCLKAILIDMVPACEHRRIPGWEIKWRAGWSVHSVCRLLRRISMLLFTHELWFRCNNVLYIISILHHIQSFLTDTIVFPQGSIARIILSAR